MHEALRSAAERRSPIRGAIQCAGVKENSMLQRTENLPAGIDGLTASGKITREDYQGVVEPLLVEARRTRRSLRLLCDFSPEFEGFTPGAAWEDAKLGLRYMRLFAGCAIVSDLTWLRESTKLTGFLIPCPVRAFGARERDEAIEWLSALPTGVAATHRLIPDIGVIVVEIHEALRAEDFDALALTADAWIEAHGDLQGLVIHVREFPGWENLGSLFRHFEFVRDHHRTVKRVALSTDIGLASLAPRLSEHFVQAEVKTFAYDALHSAVSWAGTRSLEHAEKASSHAGSPTRAAG